MRLPAATDGAVLAVSRKTSSRTGRSGVKVIFSVPRTVARSSARSKVSVTAGPLRVRRGVARRAGGGAPGCRRRLARRGGRRGRAGRAPARPGTCRMPAEQPAPSTAASASATRPRGRTTTSRRQRGHRAANEPAGAEVPAARDRPQASRTTARARASTVSPPERALSSTETRLPSSLSSHLAGDLQGRPGVVVRHHDRPGEADAVLLHRAGVAGPVGDHPGRLGHGEHAVRDHVGQADRLGDPLVPVDQVEVAGGPGVHDQVDPLDPEGLRGQLGPHLDVVVPDRHRQPPAVPRATRVEYAVRTGSPSTVETSPRVVSRSLPAAERMLSTVDRDGEPVAGPDRPGVDEALLAVHHPAVVEPQLRVDDDLHARPAWTARSAKVGGAITSGWPSARAASGSRYAGLLVADRVRELADLLPTHLVRRGRRVLPADEGLIERHLHHSQLSAGDRDGHTGHEVAVRAGEEGVHGGHVLRRARRGRAR